MSHYSALLEEMMDAIVEGNVSQSGFVKRSETIAPDAQLGIYVDAYRIRLHALLKGAYPALLQYLGEAVFSALVSGYIQMHPSRHFNIDRYPVAFAAYLAQLPSIVPAAKELAQLESAIAEMYLAEESVPLGSGWVQLQSPDSIAKSPFFLRKASRLLVFGHDVDGYVSALRAGEPLAALQRQPQYLLVLRHHYHVVRHRLEEGEYMLLALLARGATVSEALEDETMRSYNDQNDFAFCLTRWFARWASEGFIMQPL